MTTTAPQVQQDNYVDKRSGLANPRALTPEQIKHCMTTDEDGYTLAERFCVSRRTIYRAKKGMYNV